MPSEDRFGSLCDIHRCPLYGRFRGHSGHQPSELSARPPALAISLPVALLGGFEFFALPLFKLALALLGLGDLPPVVLQHATVTRFDVSSLRGFVHKEKGPAGSRRSSGGAAAAASRGGKEQVFRQPTRQPGDKPRRYGRDSVTARGKYEINHRRPCHRLLCNSD
jgi:hypothetical protein